MVKLNKKGIYGDDTMFKKRRLINGITLTKKRKKPQRIFPPQLYVPREKLYNCLWIFKTSDPDDHPSVPHAHAQEKGYRLDVWTGDVYPAGNERKKIIGKLSKKDLQKLHSDEKFIDFAIKHVEWYRSQYPNRSFFLPEWFEIKLRQGRLSAKNNVDKNDVFVFAGNVVIFRGSH